MQINKKKALTAGVGLAVIILIVFGGIFLGSYIRGSKVKLGKDSLYLANQAIIKTSVPKDKENSSLNIKLRYKPVNARSWSETSPRLGIDHDANLTQSFALEKLKTATTYEYQTQTIDAKGKQSKWSKSVGFATAREKGTAQGNAAVAYTEATNPDNPGDITFNGQAQNADFYVWDFGDGDTSTDLVETASIHHIFDFGGEYIANLTAYRYVPASESFFNKQEKYAGRAIVAQKEVKFFVNLPLEETNVTQDGSLFFQHAEQALSKSQPSIVLAEQDQAVLGNENAICSLSKNYYINGPTKIEVNEEKKVSIWQAFANKYDWLVVLSPELVEARCQINPSYVYENRRKRAFTIKCEQAATGYLTISWGLGYNRSTKKLTTTCKEVVWPQNMLKVGDGGPGKCDNSVWVWEDGLCKFRKNQCETRLNAQCVCGIEGVTATPDPVDPMKYSFTVVKSAESKAKSYKIDFGDHTASSIQVFKVNEPISHTYKNSREQNKSTYTVTVKAYPNDEPSRDDCGEKTIRVSPRTCTTGTFTATPMSGTSPLTVRFATSGGVNVASYRVNSGETQPNIYTDMTNAQHEYVIPNTYLPTLEGFDANNVSCGPPVQINPGIAVGEGSGPPSDDTCSSASWRISATPTSGAATQPSPLNVTVVADVLDRGANTLPLATKFRINWGDNSNTPDIISSNPNPPRKASFNHAYTSPNPNSSDGSYVVTVTAYPETASSPPCGSKSLRINITNTSSTAPKCGFTGNINGVPDYIASNDIGAIANADTTFTVSDIAKSDGATILPDSWIFYSGEGTDWSWRGEVKEDGAIARYPSNVMARYHYNGEYRVKLQGRHHGDPRYPGIDCGSIVKTVVVTGGEDPELCSIGNIEVIPKVAVPNQDVTLKLTNLSTLAVAYIDWGDGNTQVAGCGNPTLTIKHKYLEEGTRTIRVAGQPYRGRPISCSADTDIQVQAPTALTGASITRAGEVLTATTTPAEATATFQWKKRDTSTGEFTDDITGNTFTLTSTDVGKYFKVIATGTGVYAGSVVTSNPFGPITTIPDPPPSVPIVTIGTQTWMQNNMNVGTRIDGGTTQTGLTKWCYNNLESNCTTYGGLYQWNTAMQYVTTEGAQGICPAGFHIPTDAEYTTLTTYFGGESVAGDKMKSASLCQGRTPCGASGFNALLGGYYGGGSWYDLGSLGYFWSSSQASASATWLRTLALTSDRVSRFGTGMPAGFSVRCIHNLSIEPASQTVN